jgi:hypothetical protein
MVNISLLALSQGLSQCNGDLTQKCDLDGFNHQCMNVNRDLNIHIDCLVVSTPLKNIWKSAGMIKIPIYGKIKNVPNHLPVEIVRESWFNKTYEWYSIWWDNGDLSIHIEILLGINQPISGGFTTNNKNITTWYWLWVCLKVGETSCG